MAPPPAFAAGWPAARPLLHAAARAPQRLWPLPAAARCCATAASDAVRSLQNPRVKAARALLRRRGRERGAQLLVEGHRLVLDAAAAGHAPEALFYTEDALARGEYGQRLRALVRARSDGESAVLVTTEVMAAISDTVTPQGCVAILAQPDIPLPSTSSLVLVCDAVRDPGNVGTLLRAAAGAGVDGAILTAGCADAWGLKALRAGMGAQLRLPVLTGVDWPTIGTLLRDEFGCDVCVADGEDASPRGGEAARVRRPAVHYTKHDWVRSSALVVGSEADGPSAEAHALATTRVSIPLANGTESLNAAVAGSVILFEASRQRAAGRL